VEVCRGGGWLYVYTEWSHVIKIAYSEGMLFMVSTHIGNV